MSLSTCGIIAAHSVYRTSKSYCANLKARWMELMRMIVCLQVEHEKSTARFQVARQSRYSALAVPNVIKREARVYKGV